MSTHGLTYEIHPMPALSDDPGDPIQLPWHATQPADQPAPFAVAESDGVVHVSVDPATGSVQRAAVPADAAVALRVVRRRLSPDLAVVPLVPGVQVNGLPAPPLVVVTTKDTIQLAPGCLAYITERFTPFVGFATGDLLKQKCSVCRLKFDEKTRVVTCRCGAAMHYETQESHPDVPATERLNCFEKVRVCISCGRTVSLEPYIVWSPATL